MTTKIVLDEYTPLCSSCLSCKKCVDSVSDLKKMKFIYEAVNNGYTVAINDDGSYSFYQKSSKPIKKNINPNYTRSLS